MKKKIMAEIVATTSLPAVYRPNDDRWNAARSCQKGQENWIHIVFSQKADLVPHPHHPKTYFDIW